MPSFDYEIEARSEFHATRVAGIDEAGRGPLAGAVFAAAVIIPEGYDPDWLVGLDDSKKLSEKKREVLYEQIRNDAKIEWSIAEASVDEIDEVNILQATYLAMGRAAKGLKSVPEHCLIDGRPVPNFPFPSSGLVKGDAKSYSIAAASILAKVARDHVMLQIAKEYPEYHFHKHKGYGTKLHLEALKEHGVSPYHRRSFRPVAECLTSPDNAL